MKIFGLITARGGSKRIPRKNVKLFLGKPLLYWTIKIAQESGIFDRLVLSTDDEEIASVGRASGAEVPFLRPTELAQDDTGSLPVVRHTLDFLKSGEGYDPDWVVLLEPTSPGRRPHHLQNIFEMIQQAEKGIDSIVSVSELPSHFHPLKILKKDEKGFLIRHNDGELIRNLTHRNQELPESYFINSAIYAFKKYNLYQEPASLWGDKVLSYLMDNKYALDIDTPDDWLVAEAKMKKILEEEGSNF